jgi:hypothetical protein
MSTRLVVACPRCRAHIMPPPLPPGSTLFACTCGQRMTLPPGYNHMGPVPQQAPQTYTVSTGPGGVSVMFVPPGYTASAPAPPPTMTPPSTMSYTVPSHVPMTGSGGAPAATGKGGFMPPVSLPSAPSRTGYGPIATSSVASASTTGPPAMYAGHPSGGTVVSCGRCRTNMLGALPPAITSITCVYVHICVLCAAHTDVVLCPTCGMRVERGLSSMPTMTVNPYAKPQ